MHNVTVESMGNHMFVRFKSDGSIRGKGFKATFSSQEGGCGGRMTAPSGKKCQEFKATFSSQEGGCGGRMTSPSGKKWG